MRTYCEVVVTDLLPAMRAMIARNLMDSGLNQSETAKKLGVSQPAISQYLRMIRGSKKPIVMNEEIKKEIKKLSDEILADKITKKDISGRLCHLCRIARDKKLLCPGHKSMYPHLGECDACPVC